MDYIVYILYNVYCTMLMSDILSILYNISDMSIVQYTVYCAVSDCTGQY